MITFFITSMAGLEDLSSPWATNVGRMVPRRDWLKMGCLWEIACHCSFGGLCAVTAWGEEWNFLWINRDTPYHYCLCCLRIPIKRTRLLLDWNHTFFWAKSTLLYARRSHKIHGFRKWTTFCYFVPIFSQSVYASLFYLQFVFYCLIGKHGV